MKNLLCRAVFLVVLTGIGVAAWASPAAAGELKLSIADGRVTLIAQDVPIRQILAEWARIGKTTIVNGDKLTGPALTLELVDRPEREVLEVLLRSASGYIAAQRAVILTGASVFESVMILPTSRGPVGVAASAPPTQFPRPGIQPTQQMPVQQQMPVMDEDDPVETPNPAGVIGNQPAAFPPGMFPPPNQGQPGQQQPVLTAPRPGMLPPPPPGQPNPYGTPGPLPPGVRPPGGQGETP
jgi:hypothetical protein